MPDSSLRFSLSSRSPTTLRYAEEKDAFMGGNDMVRISRLSAVGHSTFYASLDFRSSSSSPNAYRDHIIPLTCIQSS